MIRGGLVTLFVRDVANSVRFYVETLGMKLVEQSQGSWAMIDAGEGFRIGLHEAPGLLEGEGRHVNAPTVGLYPKVPLHEAVAIYENRGVEFEVRNDGPVTLAHFTDPDGNLLCLRQDR